MTMTVILLAALLPGRVYAQDDGDMDMQSGDDTDMEDPPQGVPVRTEDNGDQDEEEASTPEIIVDLDEFSLLRFTPAAGTGGFIAAAGASIAPHLAPDLSVTIDHADAPMRIRRVRCEDEDSDRCESSEYVELVPHVTTFQFAAAMGLFDQLQIGLNLPLSINESGADFPPTADDRDVVRIATRSGFAFGDPRIEGKYAIGLNDEEQRIGVAVRGWATVPLGRLLSEGHFTGDPLPTLGVSFVGELQLDQLRVGANVGGQFRKSARYVDFESGPELLYAFAADYRPVSQLGVMAEIAGAAPILGNLTPMEVRLAGHWNSGDARLFLGGAASILPGAGLFRDGERAGSPRLRMFAGFSWASRRYDADADGVEDADDYCPEKAEDPDGFMDEDGCPDPDNDGDGFEDAQDSCPDEPEDVDEFEDEDGCPEADNDGDGIEDGYDSCVSEPEDMDGDRDEDGCPDDDADRDGVKDAQDKCPDALEDTDGLGDDDGCPETDFDGDGFLDEDDLCPEQMESWNGLEDDDGCPEPDQDGDTVSDARDRCPDSPETLNALSDRDGCPDGQALLYLQGTTLVPTWTPTFDAQGTRPTGGRSRNTLTTVVQVWRRIHKRGSLLVRQYAPAGDPLAPNRLASTQAFLVEQGLPPDSIQAETQEGSPARFEFVLVPTRSEEPVSLPPATTAP